VGGDELAGDGLAEEKADVLEGGTVLGGVDVRPAGLCLAAVHPA